MHSTCRILIAPTLLAMMLSACQLSKSIKLYKEQGENARHNGGLDPTHIDGTIGAHLVQIRACYENQLRVFPDLRGGVKIKFTIAEDGKVSEAAIHSTSLHSQTTEDCLIAVFNDMVFPRPANGVVMVQYPFLFDS